MVCLLERFLADCLRGRQLIPMETAVRLMTHAPATLFGLRGRGMVTEGAWADVMVFDPATVVDQAVFGASDQASRGFVHVIVNGVPVVRDSRLVDGAFPGRPVLGNGRSP